ncbi:hypothetical protein pEaSNUABM6_00223 [Erwinia phage pEa_SNUABM_6]|nr:hypothetical protein pEaSNUABM6_00223 [Erwinia phage pEa_SNUABM_6]
MLRVNTPELLLFNPSLVEGLFDKMWDRYFREELQSNPWWDKYRGDFFLDSSQITLDVFSRCVEEVVQAANLRRPMDFSYITFDFSWYMDNYNYECDLGIDDQEKIENKMFDFFHFAINQLVSTEFLEAAQKRLEPTWEALTELVGQRSIVGFWYEPVEGQMKMDSGRDHVWAVQEGDYDCELYAEWQGARAGTLFYHATVGDGNEFYLFNGSLIQDGQSLDHIPYGEMVTLCRLTEQAQTIIDL